MSTDIDTTLPGQEPTVAELAVVQPGALTVFTKYNIDFCCEGHRGLTEACHQLGLDPEAVRAEIRQTSQTASPPALRFDHWSSSLLVDFIVENHHAFVREAIPELATLLEMVCARHGDDSPDLLKIKATFHALSDELTSHMEKEESVLFPAIKRIEMENGENHLTRKIIQGPIVAMEDEHQLAGDLIKQIRLLSANYTPPDFACPSFLLAYQKLKAFDNDLMRHIHLENNILFERYKDGQE